MQKTRVFLIFLIFIPIYFPLTACARNDLPDLAPDEILSRSAARMSSLQGFHLLFDRSGAPAFLDSGETLSLSKMEGHYDTPDRVRATVRVIAPGIVADVDVISIGSIQWQTNVYTGEWEELPADWGFNPGTLFDQKIGLQAILLADVSQLELLEMQELAEMPGKKLYVMQGKLSGDTIFSLSNGLIGPDEMDIELWIDPQTFDLHRVILSEHLGDEDNERFWQFDFWDFDKVEGINPPILGSSLESGIT